MLVFVWPFLVRLQNERVIRAAEALQGLGIGRIEPPRREVPKRGKPRITHRSPPEQLAFLRAAKDRLGYACIAGKTAFSGHDNQVQDEWMLGTQKLIFEIFGQGDAFLFLEPPDAPLPHAGVQPKNQTERRTHNQTEYVRRLSERVDQQIAQLEQLFQGGYVYHPYPAVRYHRTEQPRTVQNAEEDMQLGDEWADTPDVFK